MANKFVASQINKFGAKQFKNKIEKNKSSENKEQLKLESEMRSDFINSETLQSIIDKYQVAVDDGKLVINFSMKTDEAKFIRDYRQFFIELGYNVDMVYSPRGYMLGVKHD